MIGGDGGEQLPFLVGRGSNDASLQVNSNTGIVAASRAEDDLSQFLSSLLDWASNEEVPADQHWRPAAEALAAGRAYV